MHGGIIDLTGQRFGRLTVICQSNASSPICWLCECDCGTRKPILGSSLRNGKTKSCGCLRREVMRDSHTVHNGCKEALHGVHNAMKQRCQNPRSQDFEFYGARGITVCDEWQDYVPFRDWALSNGYARGLTIERKDNDGNYCPENCIWIPLKYQARNRRPRTEYLLRKKMEKEKNDETKRDT